MIHTHTIPLRHRVYIQGDFGCRTTDGEATALIPTAYSGSDSRPKRHRTLPDQRPLMPTSLLHMILSMAPGLLTLPGAVQTVDNNANGHILLELFKSIEILANSVTDCFLDQILQSSGYSAAL